MPCDRACEFFFFFLYRRAARPDGIFIADLACLRNWTPTDGGSRPNPAAFIYAKRDQKRSTHVYRVARKNRQQLTATYPLKGMDDFHHTGRVRFATRGFWGKGVGFIISDRNDGSQMIRLIQRGEREGYFEIGIIERYSFLPIMFLDRFPNIKIRSSHRSSNQAKETSLSLRT